MLPRIGELKAIPDIIDTMIKWESGVSLMLEQMATVETVLEEINTVKNKLVGLTQLVLAVAAAPSTEARSLAPQDQAHNADVEVMLSPIQLHGSDSPKTTNETENCDVHAMNTANKRPAEHNTDELASKRGRRTSNQDQTRVHNGGSVTLNPQSLLREHSQLPVDSTSPVSCIAFSTPRFEFGLLGMLFDSTFSQDVPHSHIPAAQGAETRLMNENGKLRKKLSEAQKVIDTAKLLVHTMQKNCNEEIQRVRQKAADENTRAAIRMKESFDLLHEEQRKQADNALRVAKDEAMQKKKSSKRSVNLEQEFYQRRLTLLTEEHNAHMNMADMRARAREQALKHDLVESQRQLDQTRFERQNLEQQLVSERTKSENLGNLMREERSSALEAQERDRATTAGLQATLQEIERKLGAETEQSKRLMADAAQLQARLQQRDDSIATLKERNESLELTSANLQRTLRDTTDKVGIQEEKLKAQRSRIVQKNFRLFVLAMSFRAKKALTQKCHAWLVKKNEQLAAKHRELMAARELLGTLI